MILDYKIETSNKTKLDELNELLEKYALPSNVTGSVEINGVEVKTRFVEITPTLAQEILTKYQRNNRRLSPENLSFITKQMLEGTFKFNGESIIFNEEGGLDDGNHRINSIVNSGKSYVFTVVTGLNKEAFMTMGTGKKRTGNDVFDIMRVPSASLASSSTRFIYLFRNNKYRKGANSVASLSNQALYEYYLELDGFDEWVKLGNRLYKQSEKLVTGTLFVGFSYLLNKIDPIKAADFMDKFSSGADLGKYSPILALRNKLIKARDSKNFHMEYNEVIKTIFYAWEKFQNNENVKVLKLPENYEINYQTRLLF